MNFVCQICCREFKSIRNLAIHVAWAHKIRSQSYYNSFMKKSEDEGFCHECGKPTTYQALSVGYSRYCSTKCAESSPEAVQRKHNLKVSDEQVEKLRRLAKERHADPVFQAYLTDQIRKGHQKRTSRKNSYPKNRKSCGHLSEVHKLNLSIAMVKSGVAGKRNFTGWSTKGHFVSKKNPSPIWYASSWEERAFELLESDAAVVAYGRCPTWIPYTDSCGVRHNYLPDILVTYREGLKHIVEVKADYDANTQLNQCKFNAAIDFCKRANIVFDIWTSKELGIRPDAPYEIRCAS